MNGKILLAAILILWVFSLAVMLLSYRIDMRRMKKERKNRIIKFADKNVYRSRR